MNLNRLVNGAVASISPNITVSIQRSTGYTTGYGGVRTPTYAAAVSVQCQVQALSYQDMKQADGLNLNGERYAVYIDGSYDGVSRPESVGGDLLTFPDGSVWLVAFRVENWQDIAGWVKVIVTRQND